jgi:hypothetical protein
MKVLCPKSVNSTGNMDDNNDRNNKDLRGRVVGVG